jgi:hypothetical protein
MHLNPGQMECQQEKSPDILSISSVSEGSILFLQAKKMLIEGIFFFASPQKLLRRGA